MTGDGRLERGDTVRIRHATLGGDWCEAAVFLASKDSKSIGLILDGAVRAAGGIIMGGLPLTIDYEACRATGLTGDEYEIDVRSDQVTFSPGDH